MAGKLQRPLWILHSRSPLSFVLPFPMLLKESEHSSTAKHTPVFNGLSLNDLLPSHSTGRATRSRTDVSLPTCAGFEKQFRRQETGREKERERKKRDTETKTHRERQRDRRS